MTLNQLLIDWINRFKPIFGASSNFSVYTFFWKNIMRVGSEQPVNKFLEYFPLLFQNKKKTPKFTTLPLAHLFLAHVNALAPKW